jgi:hypothetical protein
MSFCSLYCEFATKSPIKHTPSVPHEVERMNAWIKRLINDGACTIPVWVPVEIVRSED